MKSLVILGVGAAVAGGFWLTRSTPVEAASETPAAKSAAQSQRRVRAVGQLGPGRGTIIVQLKAPKGGKLTEGAPLSIKGRGQDIRVTPVKGKLRVDKLPVRVPVDVADGATGPVELDVSFYWCRQDGKGRTAACSPEKGRVVVDLDLTGDAAGGEAFFPYQVR